MARKRAVTSGRRARRSGRATARAGQANVATYKALEMSSPASSPASSPPKRKPPKAAPRGKWSEEQLLTSDESVLIDADLVKLLARPEAWDILEEHEKREILALLPADTHPASELPPDDPDAMIPPLPESFVRYSNNWRDGVRQFQLDLQNGRFDPEWLRQAEVARRKRERGDFDSFKEREFEKFWGQKQRTSDATMSGESSKVKLTQLIEAGVFLVGDVWRFGYVYGKGPDRIIIDKEVRIHEINDRKLTFVVPTGQRVFLRSHTVAADPKQESGQTDGHEVKEAQSTDVLMTEAPEPGPLKQESPVNNTPKKVELQSDSGLQNLDHGPKLEDTEAESKQENQVNGEALEVPANAETKSHDENGSVQVVIVSPRHKLDVDRKGFKRPTPLPAVEPPVKRKRGRPRKIPLPSAELESEPDMDSVAEAVPSQAQQLEVQREGGVQVVIGVDSSALLRAELLSQIELPAPSPGMARLLSTKHDAMDSVNTPRKAELEPAKNEPTSSPLSSPRSIMLSSPLIEAPEWLNDDHTEETIKEHTEQRTEQPSKERIEVPTEEPTEVPGHERTEEHIEESFEMPTEESNEVPTEMPTEAPAEVSAQETTEKLTDEHIELPVEEPVIEPVDGLAQPPPEPQTTTDEPDEIIVSGISSPMVLVKLILQIDGRRPDGRTANSWKEIRCYRKNQDMGSLFDVRQAWYLKQK